MESVLGVVTCVTSESIGAVVSVSPSDSSDSSVPPSIPSSFEDEVLHHAKNMWSKSIRKNKLIIDYSYHRKLYPKPKTSWASLMEYGFPSDKTSDVFVLLKSV